MTLVYLPHLDYEYQRKTEHDPERVAEVDRCAGHVIDAATEVGAALSRYLSMDWCQSPGRYH